MENAIVSVMPNGGAVPESVLGFLDLPGLLPQNRQFYTYTGSLTTPRYSPCVQWTVFTEPIRISSDQVGLLPQEKRSVSVRAPLRHDLRAEECQRRATHRRACVRLLRAG